MNHPRSSLHQHYRTRHSNLVRKIWLPAAVLQKIHIHLPQPDQPKIANR